MLVSLVLLAVEAVAPAADPIMNGALSGLLGSGPLVAVLAYALRVQYQERVAAQAEAARLREACKACASAHTEEIKQLYREVLGAVRAPERKEGSGER